MNDARRERRDQCWKSLGRRGRRREDDSDSVPQRRTWLRRGSGLRFLILRARDSVCLLLVIAFYIIVALIVDAQHKAPYSSAV